MRYRTEVSIVDVDFSSRMLLDRLNDANIDDLSSRYNLSDIIERTCTIYDNSRFCNLPACVKCVKIMFARL